MKFTAQSNVNAIAVPMLLLRELGVKVTDVSITEKLEEHPHFPSLMSVADCFDEWNVPNLAFRVPKEKYSSKELQFPVIAQINSNGGQFILIHEIKDGSVIYSDETSERKPIAEDEFLKRWSGILLYAEAAEDSGEKEYFLKTSLDIISNLRIPFLILVTIVLLAMQVDFSKASLNYILLLIVKLFGIGISIMLLAHTVNINSSFVQNLCSLGKRNDCNAILNSEAAKATSWMSWSEVGFFYFSGSFLSLLSVPSSISLIAILNILALPYTLWSIYYQYNLKNWCILCCSVQAILWLEFLATWSSISWSFNVYYSTTYFGVILSFLFPMLLWYTFKPLLRKTIDHKPLKQQLRIFKYNSELFTSALTKQPRFAIPEEIAPIILGNKGAQTIITMVSNPFCNPCAKAHEVLDKWLKTRDDIQLKIIFTTADNENDQKTMVARHLTALSLTQDAKLVEQALNQWYMQREKNYLDWAKNYNVEICEKAHAAVKKQKQWCKLADITSTPTILVNGYKLPKPYRLEDIQHLVS